MVSPRPFLLPPRFKKVDRRKKLFDLLKLSAWLAVAIWLAWGAVDRIGVAHNHTGDGIVEFESGTETMDESGFKRHHYSEGGLMLFFSGVIIFFACWSFKEPCHSKST